MDNLSISPSREKISLPWLWQPVKRRMLPGCEFFADGDAVIHSAQKFFPLDNVETESIDHQDELNVEKDVIPCCVIGCKQTFTCLLGYENHYNSVHRHSCVTCHRAFPGAFLLDIHIQENHDSLFAIMATKHSMYRCVVESCQEKFPDPDRRRDHLIKLHHYPSNFRFHRLHPASSKHKKQPKADSPCVDIAREITAAGQSDQSFQPDSSFLEGQEQCMFSSDKETLRAKGGSAEKGTNEEMMEMQSTPRTVYVHKVPVNFSFGHGVSRGFQRSRGKNKGKGKKHWHQQGFDSNPTKTNIENVDMTEMAHALNDTG